MVVCNCRKATKLYCFVHKIPVCGKCICSPEHQICVVRTYSEWVIDGEYEWPPRCCKCLAELDEGSSLQTTRLGCLHIAHTNCLLSHIKSFPSHTAPAGYVCPSCSNSIWPPKSVMDSSSKLHSQLKEVIMLSGMEKNLFGNHSISTDPLKNVSSNGRKEYGSSLLPSEEDNATSNGYLRAGGRPSKLTVTEIVEVDGPNSPGSYMKNSSPVATVATTRKSTAHYQRQDSEISYFADDEDGSLKKYSRRGSFRQKFLRSLLPFWSSALPTLPVSAPPCKDAKDVDDIQEGRLRHQRTSQMDPRKILLLIAIIACMATMGILYYKLAQRALTEDDEELVADV